MLRLDEPVMTGAVHVVCPTVLRGTLKCTVGTGLVIIGVVRVTAPPKRLPGAGPEPNMSPTIEVVVAVVTKVAVDALTDAQSFRK